MQRGAWRPKELIMEKIDTYIHWVAQHLFGGHKPHAVCSHMHRHMQTPKAGHTEKRCYFFFIHSGLVSLCPSLSVFSTLQAGCPAFGAHFITRNRGRIRFAKGLFNKLKIEAPSDTNPAQHTRLESRKHLYTMQIPFIFVGN